MFSHIMIGTNDLDRAKSFYDALLGTLGVRPARSTATASSTDQDRRLLGVEADQRRAGDPRQWRHHRLRGRLARAGRRLARGRRRQRRHDLRGSAGRARRRAAKLYLAYLRDPDGNKICALHRVPE